MTDRPMPPSPSLPPLEPPWSGGPRVTRPADLITVPVKTCCGDRYDSDWCGCAELVAEALAAPVITAAPLADEVETWLAAQINRPRSRDWSDHK